MGLEGVGDPPNRAERRRLLSALQATEVRAVDAAGERRRFLAQIAFLAEFPERVSEGLGARACHRGGSLSCCGLLLHGLKYPGLKDPRRTNHEAAGGVGVALRRGNQETIQIHRLTFFVVLLISGLFGGVASADGAALSGAGISGTVTASLKPADLPKRGSAPVTLSVSGTISDGTFKSLTLTLDPQLAISAAGLPICQPQDVTGVVPAAARRKCGGALVGSGGLMQRFQYPEQPPIDLHASLLFFNGAGGRLLSYAYVPGPEGAYAAAKASPTNGGVVPFVLPFFGGTTTAFQFHIGRTWHRRGHRLSYLGGRCATGTLRNRITLTASSGSTASALLPQPCQGRA